MTTSSQKESTYQKHLIDKVKKLLPDCVIFKLPPEQYQGIPDLLILFENKWAVLEVKISKTSLRQPNQEHYINLFDQMSFGAFIYPEIEESVLNELLERFRF